MEFWGLESVFAAICAVMTVGLTGALIWMRQHLISRQLAAQARIDAIEAELRALTNASVGVGRKVIGMEQRLHTTEKQTQELVLSDPVKISYNEAGRLLELGADVDDLVVTCGLSRPEAELIAALHSQRSSA